MSQDVGQRLKIKIQRLKIKIQCLKIKTKKGLLMVWWRPLPSPASQQPASLEASRPEVAPPAQPWPAWRPAPTASRPEVAPPLQPTSSHSPPTPEVAPPPKPSHPAHWPRPPAPAPGCDWLPALARPSPAHDVTTAGPNPQGQRLGPPGHPHGLREGGGPLG